MARLFLIDPINDAVVRQSMIDVQFAHEVTQLNFEQRILVIDNDKCIIHFSDEMIKSFYEIKERMGNYEKIHVKM